MKFLRSKNTAAECKSLAKIAIPYPNNPTCTHVSFACINEKVCNIHDGNLAVTFDSLDFCCICEYFSKD